MIYYCRCTFLLSNIAWVSQSEWGKNYWFFHSTFFEYKYEMDFCIISEFSLAVWKRITCFFLLKLTDGYLTVEWKFLCDFIQFDSKRFRNSIKSPCRIFFCVWIGLSEEFALQAQRKSYVMFYMDSLYFECSFGGEQRTKILYLKFYSNWRNKNM